MKGFISLKKRHKLLFVCFLILTVNTFGQNLRILNTKELIGISEMYGLDSALILTKGIDVFHIDQSTTEQLIKQIKNNEPSDRIERFLVDYALCVTNTNLSEVLYEYFNRKANEIKDYVSGGYSGAPCISQNSLFALIENPSKQTDSLFLNYYNLWDEKTTYYKHDYEIGMEERDARKKEILMYPYENSNYNCYILQRFLKEMKSPFYNQEKLEYHQKRMAYYLRDGFAIGKNVDCSKYALKNNIFKTIKLTKSYNSIGEIDFEEEVELRELLNRYNESHCWKFIMYNDKEGYLDLGCQSGPLAGHGVFYRLELRKDKLIIHELYMWVS